MRRGLLWMVAAAAALIPGGCGEPGITGGRPVALTVVPAHPGPLLPEPELRYPPGSRLERHDLEHPGAEPRWISEGMAAAGGASISVEGRELAFVGRLQEEDRFAVWTASPSGGERRPVAGAPEGAGAVAWLPHGRLVVAAPVEDRPPIAGMASAWALFVVAPEEESAQRITFGAGELDPSVLSDGRILYSQWQPGGDGRPEGGGFSLFTVHPDGTGAAPLHGHHGGARLKLLARQTADEDLVFLAGEREATELRGMDWGRPDEASFSVAPPGLPADLKATSAEPTARGELLVAAADAAGGSGLWLLHRPPAPRLALAAPAGSRFTHAVEIAARPRPQGHLSMVDPAAEAGRLLCIDARPPGLPEARRVRLTAGADGAARQLGELPLAADGSFFAVVPPDRPLYLDLLDADGRVLMTTRTPIWVRPKEVRACVGCHDSQLTAPPNRRPLAVLDEPWDLTATRDG